MIIETLQITLSYNSDIKTGVIHLEYTPFNATHEWQQNILNQETDVQITKRQWFEVSGLHATKCLVWICS